MYNKNKKSISNSQSCVWSSPPGWTAPASFSERCVGAVNVRYTRPGTAAPGREAPLIQTQSASVRSSARSSRQACRTTSACTAEKQTGKHDCLFKIMTNPYEIQRHNTDLYSAAHSSRAQKCLPIKKEIREIRSKFISSIAMPLGKK